MTSRRPCWCSKPIVWEFEIVRAKFSKFYCVIWKKNSLKIQWISWHFVTPFFHLLQYYLNMLSKAKIPIWLTEVDVLEKNPFKRADALETVMRAAFSNPNVQGLILWSFWSQSSWRGPYTSLVDGNDWQVSKNTTYPSLKLTLTLHSHLGQNVGEGEG